MKKKQLLKQGKIGEIGFLCIILILPITNFLVFYLYVNIDSLMLAFQKIDLAGVAHFAGFENFKTVFSEIGADPLIRGMLGRSFAAFAVTVFVGFPLNLLFAYVIYKKVPASGFFQVVLFLPSIISSMVITLMFRYMVENIIATIFEVQLLENHAFPTYLFYMIWSSFGVQLVIYTGAMSRIPESVVEAASLDGITPMKEFLYITLPMVYGTITIFLVTTIASIFTNQMNILNFEGPGAMREHQTIGFYIFQQVIPGGSTANIGDYSKYPYAAAYGMLFTFIIAPITLVGKWLLEKYGPTVEG